MNPPIDSPNLSVAWCKTILQALTGTGFRFVFLSPGYRDAPFVAALQTLPQFKVISCMDERSAAYQALGVSKFTGEPSVLICTSGTAVANYLPALLEAKTEGIPLVVISCDRPWELTFSGANQTLDQNRILGPAVKYFLALPAPEDSIGPEVLYHVVRDHFKKILGEDKGVLHFNVPLRGPLEPLELDHPRLEEFNSFLPEAILETETIQSRPSEAVEQTLKDILEGAERGILILGRLDNFWDIEVIKAFAKNLAWPIYCDVTSSLKGEFESLMDPELPCMQQWLQSYRPDTLVHIGRRLVSKYWDQYLAQNPRVKYGILSPAEDRHDPSFRSLLQLRVKDPSWLADLPIRSGASAIPDPLALEKSQMTAIIRSGDHLSLPYLASYFAEHLGEVNVFLGNSSGIRAFDTWCFTGGSGQVAANRGVSGIEGLLSTVIGLCLASKQPWNLVVGDVSMIHDLNSLFQLSLLQLPIRVFVINNGGGQIFNKLPIGKFKDVADPLLTTPHKFKLEGVARSAEIPYVHIKNRQELELWGDKPLAGPQMLELSIDPNVDMDLYQVLKSINFQGETI